MGAFLLALGFVALLVCVEECCPVMGKPGDDED
jgi:hypothetical protein